MFTEDNFTPSKFSTAQEKAKFANQFCKFIESGFAWTSFPKWFYTRLSMCFGFIAHYDQHGFYNTYFLKPHTKYDFINQVMDYPCYGQPQYTYCDVEKALQEWLAEYFVEA